MTRTATRVAAAVGATVVMMGLATPALACTNAFGGQDTAAVSATQAKNDPATSVKGAKHWSALTLAEVQAKLDAKIADKLAWLDKIEAKVSASDRLSDAQRADFLAHLQAKEDALTQLRADIAAATTVEEVKAALQAADPGVFGLGHRHHGKHFGHHDGRVAASHQHGGFGSDRGNSDNRRGFGQRSGSNHGGGWHH